MTMKRYRKQLLIIALAVVFVGSAAWLILRSRSDNTQPEAVVPPSSTAQVRISEDGFEPSTLVVKQGTVVIWKNDDTEAHRVAANPFPSHGELPSLDSQDNIAPQSDFAYTFTNKGTFHYHDELNPDRNATIIVE